MVLKNLIFALIVFLTMIFSGDLLAQKAGCTDPNANNYDPTAIINDGSCTYDDASISVSKSVILPEILKETSGLIFWKNSFFSHNDDTDSNIYQIDYNDLTKITAIPLPHIYNKEWEEISQDENYIYLGDFGNNSKGNRTDLHILRIAKSTFYEKYPKIDTIWFSYSLQSDFSRKRSNTTDFDCEAFVVTNDSIYLFTKEWTSELTSLYAIPKVPGKYVARYKSSMSVGGLITGATLLENEKVIVLCGYSQLLMPFLILLYDYQNDYFFSANKRKISISAPFNQIEGIATTNGLDYYITNEYFEKSIISVNQKIQLLDMKKFLGDYIQKVRTNIDEIKAENIKISPNPSENKIRVDFANNLIGENFQISDISGNILTSGKLKNNPENIQIDTLKSGTYFLIIKNNNFFIQKFIKE